MWVAQQLSLLNLVGLVECSYSQTSRQGWGKFFLIYLIILKSSFIFKFILFYSSITRLINSFNPLFILSFIHLYIQHFFPSHILIETILSVILFLIRTSFHLFFQFYFIHLFIPLPLNLNFLFSNNISLGNCRYPSHFYTFSFLYFITIYRYISCCFLQHIL